MPRWFRVLLSWFRRHHAHRARTNAHRARTNEAHQSERYAGHTVSSWAPTNGPPAPIAPHGGVRDRASDDTPAPGKSISHVQTPEDKEEQQEDGRAVDAVHAEDSNSVASLPSEDATRTQMASEDDVFQERVNTDDNVADVHDSKNSKRRSPKRPIAAGGRRNSGHRGNASPSGRRSRTRAHGIVPPELLCRWNKASATWQLVVEAEHLTSAFRDGQELRIHGEHCVLDSFTGRLSACHGEAQSTDVDLIGDPPVAIFKFAADWSGDGRRVSYVANGHYLVIARKEYRQIGHISHESEPCDDDSFLAFYFHTDSSTAGRIGFEGFLLPTGIALCLEGETVFDSSHDGPLFVGSPPKLSTKSGITWARIGEERSNGWEGRNFNPADESIEEVIDNRQGRFYVRVYDHRVKLVDTGEFRYIRDLRQISMNGRDFTPSLVIPPGLDGHQQTIISIIGPDGSHLIPELRSFGQASVSGTSIVVEPNVGNDRITFSPQIDAVDVVVDIPHIWWRLEEGDAELHADVRAEWQDGPLAVSRSRFRELAIRDAAVCLKVPEQFKHIDVSLRGERWRSYPRSDGSVRVPLGDYFDYAQVFDTPHEPAFLCAKLGDAEFPFLQLTPDPLPTIASFKSDCPELLQGKDATICWATRNAGAGKVALEPGIGTVPANGQRQVAPMHSATYTLRLKVAGRDDVTASIRIEVLPVGGQTTRKPCVRSSRGWRQGKGFSLPELELATSSATEAVAHRLRVDARRRTAHSCNVKALKELVHA